MNVVEAVENTTEDLGGTFGRERFYAKMLPKLSSDKCVLEILGISKRFDNSVRVGFLDLLKAFYEKVPPRLHRVHQLVKDFLGQDNEKLHALVEEIRKKGIDKGSAQSKEFDDVYPTQPPEWNSWRKDDRSDGPL